MGQSVGDVGGVRCEVWGPLAGGVEAWCEVWRVGDWSCSHGLSPGTNIQTPGDSRGHHRTPLETTGHQGTPVETRIITRQASSSNTDWPHAGIPSIKKDHSVEWQCKVVTRGKWSYKNRLDKINLDGPGLESCWLRRLFWSVFYFYVYYSYQVLFVVTTDDWPAHFISASRWSRAVNQALSSHLMATRNQRRPTINPACRDWSTCSSRRRPTWTAPTRSCWSCWSPRGTSPSAWTRWPWTRNSPRRRWSLSTGPSSRSVPRQSWTRKHSKRFIRRFSLLANLQNMPNWFLTRLIGEVD